MTNGAIEALVVLFQAEMMMLPVVPSSAALGKPLRAPVAELNLAQAGCPEMLKEMRVLLPETVGVKEYWVPAMTLVGGSPLIVMLGTALPEETAAAAGAAESSSERQPAIQNTQSNATKHGRRAAHRFVVIHSPLESHAI
jgi:hypothetical protein